MLSLVYLQHIIRQIASITSAAATVTVTPKTTAITGRVALSSSSAFNNEAVKVLKHFQKHQGQQRLPHWQRVSTTQPQWTKSGHAPTKTHRWLHTEWIILLDHHHFKLIFNMFCNTFRGSHASSAANSERSAFNRWVSHALHLHCFTW